MKRQLLVVGAGGHGSEVAWLARDTGDHHLVGFVDTHVAVGTEICGLKVLGGNDIIAKFPSAEVVVAIGDLRRRKQAVTALTSQFAGLRFATLVHPSVIMSDSVVFGKGSIICAGAILTVNVRIGEHVIVNVKSAVGHGAVVHDFCTLGPGSIVCGNAELGPGVEVAAGALIRQGLRLGAGSMAAMGAVVMKDVPQNAMVLGNPARPIQKIPDSFLEGT